MRRVVMLALLLYLVTATATLTARFVTFGDGVSAAVDRVMSRDPIRVGAARVDSTSGNGIDFIECFGCERLLPGAEGFPLALMGFVVAGTPLAFRAFAWRRRRRAGGPLPGSGVAQFAAVVQATSLALSIWLGPVFLNVLPYDPWSLVFLALGSMAVVNVVLGLPALYAWRELYAEAFAHQPRGFFAVAGQ